MDKNDVEMPKKKVDKIRVMTISSVLIAAVLLVLDLYLMINKPGSYAILLVVTLLLLVEIYLFLDAILKEINKNKELAEENYGKLFKSGKGSYLLLKKMFEQMEALEKKDAGVPGEDIITAQRAIAKVIVSRDKENTDALMNSNDKVLEKIFDFEEQFESNQGEILKAQRNLIDDFMKDLTEKQQELIGSVKEMQASLKMELMQTKEAISALQEKMAALPESEKADMPSFEEMLPDQPMAEEVVAVPEEVVDVPEEVVAVPEEKVTVPEEKPDMSEIDLMFDSLNMGEDENLSEGELNFDDFNLGESENLLEDDLTFDGIDLGEDISSIENELALEDEPLAKDEPPIEALAEDILPEDEPSIEELVKNVLPEDELEEKEEKKLEMPDLSDPHKMMTPEEIAALIANM